MKYLRDLKMVLDSQKHCRVNFSLALEALGRINPYAISKLSLRTHRRIDDFSNLSKKDYIKLGEMNLYKKLNRCLTPSRKYSMRMIRRIKDVRIAPHKDAGVSQYLYRVSLPVREFVTISKALASLLKKYDNSSYVTLTAIESAEQYLGKNAYSNAQLHTISPIQCAIAIRATVVSHRSEDRKKLVDDITSK